MVRLKDVQGRIYRFKSKSECLDLGILTPDVPDIVRYHMVLVLGLAPGKRDYVQVMTITSKLRNDGEYVPISPTPKKGFAIQLRLRNYCMWWQRDEARRCFTVLPLDSYLKIDEGYEVPVQMLEEARDWWGNPRMIWARRRGGVGELRWYVRWRERIREEEGKRQAEAGWGVARIEEVGVGGGGSGIEDMGLMYDG